MFETESEGAVCQKKKLSQRKAQKLLLRQPSYRAYSHWRMEVGRKQEQHSFEQTISEFWGRSRVRRSPFGVHRIFSYVKRGFYAGQIRRLFKYFPRENILFLRADALWKNTSTVLAKVEAFLSIDACP